MDILSPDDDFGSVLLGPAVEFKAAPTGVIEGYASTFNGMDSHGDTVQPGAYAETLAKHKSAQTAPAMLWSHDIHSPIGKWLAMGEDSTGLRVRGQINLETDNGREAMAHIKGSDVKGLSIGFRVPAGGAQRQGVGRLLKSLDLFEVSLVSIGSDAGARIHEVKSLGSRGDLEDLLQKSGLPRGAARKIAAAGWPALSGEQDHAIDPGFALIAKALDLTIHELKTMKG